MPPSYLETLQKEKSTSDSNVEEGQGKLQDLSASIDKVRGGDLADLQVGDPELQVTLDEHDTNIRRLSGTVAGQTDRYQASAQGAYRFGTREGRRLLGEAEKTISLDLEQVVMHARQQRLNAINTYREITAQEVRDERALALQLGAQAYSTEVAEEERLNRQNDKYKETFTTGILAGEEYDDAYIAAFAESSGRTETEVRELVKQSGDAAILSVRQLAQQQGVPLNEEDIDFSSTATTIASIRALIAEKVAEDRQLEQEQVDIAQKKLDLDTKSTEALITKYQSDDENEKARIANERQKIANSYEIALGKRLGESGCINMKSQGERDKCFETERARFTAENLPPNSQNDRETLDVVNVDSMFRTLTGEPTEAQLKEAKRATAAYINTHIKPDPETGEYHESSIQFIFEIAEKYNYIGAIGGAEASKDPNAIIQAVIATINSPAEGKPDIVRGVARFIIDSDIYNYEVAKARQAQEEEAERQRLAPRAREPAQEGQYQTPISRQTPIGQSLTPEATPPAEETPTARRPSPLKPKVNPYLPEGFPFRDVY